MHNQYKQVGHTERPQKQDHDTNNQAVVPQVKESLSEEDIQRIEVDP